MTAAVALFVVVVIALWVRHRSAQEENKRRLAALVLAARTDDLARVDAIGAAMRSERASDRDRPCPITTRVKVVRLERIDSQGGRLHDVIADIAAEREPAPWKQELDVVDGRAFLFDYESKRVVCVGKDAEDPHGTLVAF